MPFTGNLNFIQDNCLTASGDLLYFDNKEDYENVEVMYE
jgi:hypothetical protein